MSLHVTFYSVCSSFQISLFFLLCAKLVLDELAYVGLSFRICAIKVFWVLYFAQGKLYGCHTCCILKQIFILLMLRNTENKMELWVTVLQFCFLLAWIENLVKDISENVQEFTINMLKATTQCYCVYEWNVQPF